MLLDGTAVAVVVEEVGGGGEVVDVAGVGDLARVEELLALLLDEALDLEQLGDLEQPREVVLRHVDLTLVHVVQDGPDLLVLDVLRRKRLRYYYSLQCFHPRFERNFITSSLGTMTIGERQSKEVRE